MVRSRGRKKVDFDTKLIIYTIAANSIVKQVPVLINKMMTIPTSLNTLIGMGVGAGAGYFLGSPELFNISLGIGGGVYVNQALNMVTGGNADASAMVLTALPSGTTAATTSVPVQTAAVSDYLRLSEYSNSPLINKNYFDQYANN